MQGKHVDALGELSKMCLILQVFPPEESSVCTLNNNLQKYFHWIFPLVLNECLFTVFFTPLIRCCFGWVDRGTFVLTLSAAIYDFWINLLGVSLQPEMEMVSRGLAKHLKLEQRKHLMFLFGKVCSEDSHGIAREALGLVRNPLTLFLQTLR